MAVVMKMHGDGITAEHYEQLRGIVRWEADPPPGLRFHVAGFDAQGAHVTDVWDTREQFEAFAEERLVPGFQEIGIELEPEIEFVEMHAVFEPHGSAIA